MGTTYTGYLLNENEKDNVGKIPNIEEEIRDIQNNIEEITLSEEDKEKINLIDTIKSNIDTLKTGKANASHTHDTYAPKTHVHSYNDLNNKPNIPTKFSQLTNDSNLVNQTYVDNKYNEVKQDINNCLKTSQIATDGDIDNIINRHLGGL